MAERRDELRADWLDRPRPERFNDQSPDFDRSMAAHRVAAEAGQPGYRDPTTGLFVMTATYLRDRGWCCDRGCRHCPYLGRADEPTPRTESEQP